MLPLEHKACRDLNTILQIEAIHGKCKKMENWRPPKVDVSSDKQYPKYLKLQT